MLVAAEVGYVGVNLSLLLLVPPLHTWQASGRFCLRIGTPLLATEAERYTP